MFFRECIFRAGLNHISKAYQCSSTPHYNILKRFATFDLNRQIASENAPKAPKKKTPIIPKITLLENNDKITVTTLEEAQKISKRRDLKLVKILDLDTKTSRPVYKLMSGVEFLAEDLKRRAERKANKNDSLIKGEKLLTISHRITDHDLSSRIRKIEKWLAKAYEVRVVVNGDSENFALAEGVYNKLEEKLKAVGRFVQKRQKGADLKFQILPPKRDAKTNDNKSNSVDNSNNDNNSNKNEQKD